MKSCLLHQRKKGRLPIPLGGVDVIYHLLSQGLSIGIFELQHLATWPLGTDGILGSGHQNNEIVVGFVKVRTTTEQLRL